MLTSYSLQDPSAKAAAARFLEQSTFGVTPSSIDSLAASLDYEGWVTDQISLSTSSHREFYRQRLNPRFEYPFYGGAAGPNKACDYSSRWRKFALSKVDGLYSFKSKKDKYLTIRQYNGQYLWLVEGHVRTVTSYRPQLLATPDGALKEVMLLEPYAYQIDDAKNKPLGTTL
eukprot:14307417-Ditylum_brightwellii.AAC.1